MAQEGGYDPLIAELIKPCPSCASIRDKNERQAEVVRSFGNSLEKAMTENSALRSSLAEKEEEIKRLREENQAFEYELKCFHDGNNGNDNH